LLGYNLSLSQLRIDRKNNIFLINRNTEECGRKNMFEKTEIITVENYKTIVLKLKQNR